MPVVGSPRIAPLERRIKNLQALFDLVRPVPEGWLTGGQSGGLSGHREEMPAVTYGPGEMQPKTCESWREVVQAWKRASRWEDGLEYGLACMLASAVSTPFIGEQLWFLCQSPPSCLHGKTPIYDPVDRTNYTVETRHRLGKGFHVWSRDGNGGVGITEALPPWKFTVEPMVEVEFRSGNRITVTLDHRLWNGSSYVAVRTIVDALRSSASYPVPSISESYLSVRTPSAFRSTRTVEDSRGRCSVDSYPYGGPPPRVLGTCLSSPPSLDGVQGRNHASWRSGGRRLLHRRIDRRYDPLSSSGACRVSPPHPSEVDGVLQRLSVDAEWSFDPCSSDEHTGLRSCQTYNARPVRFDDSRSSGGGLVELLLGLESAWQTMMKFRPFERFRSGLTRPLSWPHRCLSALGMDPFYGPALAGLRSSIDTSELRSDRPSVWSNIQPSIYPTGRGIPTLADVRSTILSSENPIVLEGFKLLCPDTITTTDAIVKVTPVENSCYFDFCVPETWNYWAAGVFHHNTLKTTLVEGLAVAKRYCYSKDTLRGFQDGTKDDDGEDRSLVARAKGKTLIIKDGDTLLKTPDLPRVLSEARGLYDRSLRTHYRNHKEIDYLGHRMSMIICGTKSLREIDESELGTRFLTAVMMEGIDDDFEDEVTWRAVNQEARNMLHLSDGKPETQYPAELAEAMALTGGYVEYLRQNALELTSEVRLDHDHLHRCGRLGKFAAYMRARPPKKGVEEETDREFAPRLAKQLVRLTTCLAVVMQDRHAGDKVIERTARVATDTGRGMTLNLIRRLVSEDKALSVRSLHLYLNRREEDLRRHLRFLQSLGVCEFEAGESAVVWRPSRKIKKLYQEVNDL